MNTFFKGAQAWEFFARVFCTKRTRLGMWLRVWEKIFLSKGRRRRSSARSGRSQQLWSLPSQTVRGFFCVCANILSAPASCRRQDYVDARILSTPIFCRSQDFVDANNFVEACILSAPIFCRCQYFVGANVLSASIFCCCQYFWFYLGWLRLIFWH